MTSPVLRQLRDVWAGYEEPYETNYAAVFGGVFHADCPTPGCGRVIVWTDNRGSGPRPGPCDCEIEEAAA